MRDCNMVIAGVGGQGVILLSRIIAEAALISGVKGIIGQSFTAAQRYGSVVAFVRIGKNIYSPLMKTNQANIIVGLEPLETLRYINFLTPYGTVLMNTYKVLPTSFMLGAEKYPELNEIQEHVKSKNGELLKVDATQIAKSSGDTRVMNVMMLGLLSTLKKFPLSESSLIESMKKNVPLHALEVNIAAFKAGQKIIAKT